MKHAVTVKLRQSTLRPGMIASRWWECSCGMVGDEWMYDMATDEQILRGGRVHVAIANKKGAKR